MTSITEPNSGIEYGWPLGDSTWKSGMDNNLSSIGRIGFQLSVMSRSVVATPTTPNDGDRYIVAAGATGAWAGNDGKVAVWDNNLSSWVYYTPKTGWVAFVEDETKLTAYYSSAWSAGIAI